MAEVLGAVADWQTHLDDLFARIAGLFTRSEPRKQARRYLEGLLGSVHRKNGWQLAEASGDQRPWRTQRVLSDDVWDQDRACEICQAYVLEHLEAPDGVLIVDETGCPRGFHGHV